MQFSQEQFAAQLHAHRGIVLKVANTYCRDAQDRQDLAQEIAAQLWRSYPRYDEARPFSTWMYRVALNVAISHLRYAGRRAQVIAPMPENGEELAGNFAFDASQSQASQESLRTLYAVICGLAPLDRALMLLWLEERSQREIAEILGTSESNVATKLSRLKVRMKQQIQSESLGHASTQPPRVAKDTNK